MKARVRHARKHPSRRAPRVLLAWDARDPAPEALTLARRLARAGARAEAVYAVPPEMSRLPAAELRVLKRSWTAALEREGLRLRFCEGKPVPALLSCIKDRHPDIVVVGTKCGWLEKVLLGSVAAALHGNASAPVLAVRSRPPRTRGAR